MNPNQLATMEEAEAIRQQLGMIGGGVVDIYEAKWVGPFGQPHDGDKKHLLFRFANGAEGVNVGLVRQVMKNNPTRWSEMLATEINAAARSDE